MDGRHDHRISLPAQVQVVDCRHADYAKAVLDNLVNWDLAAKNLG